MPSHPARAGVLCLAAPRTPSARRSHPEFGWARPRQGAQLERAAPRPPCGASRAPKCVARALRTDLVGHFPVPYQIAFLAPLRGVEGSGLLGHNLWMKEPLLSSHAQLTPLETFLQDSVWCI
jgi:hypothetical protein